MVLSGNYGALLPALTFGVNGGILAVANIAPNECVEIYELFQQGKIAEAGDLHLRLLPVARAATSQMGVPGLKAAMSVLGGTGSSLIHQKSVEYNHPLRASPTVLLYTPFLPQPDRIALSCAAST